MYEEKCTVNNKEPVPEYRYRYIFNHEFNLSFGRPFQDTCKEWDRLDMQIKSTGGEEEKKNLEPELNLHQREVKAAYEALKQDGAWSRQDPSTVVVCFDLQQVLPTPIIHTSVGFFIKGSCVTIWMFITWLQTKQVCSYGLNMKQGMK